MACNHCENPVCGLACPVKAISKREDGIVFVDTARLHRLPLLRMGLPLRAPCASTPGPTRSPSATSATTAIDAGGTPACVAACPQRALDFGDLAELRKKYGDVRRIFPLPDPAQTDPALVIKPHRDAARAEERGAEVANWEEV